MLTSTSKTARTLILSIDWECFYDRDFTWPRYLEHKLNRELCYESYKSLYWFNKLGRNKLSVFHNACCRKENEQDKKLPFMTLVESMVDVVKFKNTASFSQRQLGSTRKEIAYNGFCLSLLHEQKLIILWQLKSTRKDDSCEHKIYSFFNYSNDPDVKVLDCKFINDQTMMVQTNAHDFKIYNISKLNPLAFTADQSSNYEISITANRSCFIFEQQKNQEETTKKTIDTRSEDKKLSDSVNDPQVLENIDFKLSEISHIDIGRDSTTLLHFKHNNIILKIDRTSFEAQHQVYQISLENGVYIKEFKLISDQTSDTQQEAGVISLLFIDSLSQLNKIVVDSPKSKKEKFVLVKPTLLYDPFASDASLRERTMQKCPRTHEFFKHFTDQDYLKSVEACLFLIDADQARFQLFDLSALKSILFEVPTPYLQAEESLKAGHVHQFIIKNGNLIFLRGKLVLSAALQPSLTHPMEVRMHRSLIENVYIPSQHYLFKTESCFCVVSMNAKEILCEAFPIGTLELIYKEKRSLIEERLADQKNSALVKVPQVSATEQEIIKDQVFEMTAPKCQDELWMRPFVKKKVVSSPSLSSLVYYKFPHIDQAEKDTTKESSVLDHDTKSSLSTFLDHSSFIAGQGNKILARLHRESFFVDFDLIAQIKFVPSTASESKEALFPFKKFREL